MILYFTADEVLVIRPEDTYQMMALKRWKDNSPGLADASIEIDFDMPIQLGDKR